MMKRFFFLPVMVAAAAISSIIYFYLVYEKSFGAIGDGARLPFFTDSRLQNRADKLLFLFDNMPGVAVYLTDSPVQTSGSSIERGVAFTICEDDKLPSIFLKKDFYEKANEKQLTNILKHELTHVWLCRQNIMSGHDGTFRDKFAEVGGFGN